MFFIKRCKPEDISCLTGNFRASNMESIASKCPVACIEMEYNADVSYSLIPSQVAADEISQKYNVSTIIKNAQKQGINITSTNIEFIR